MGIGKEKLDPVTTPMFGFAGEKVLPEGSITLPVTTGSPPHTINCYGEILSCELSFSLQYDYG